MNYKKVQRQVTAGIMLIVLGLAVIFNYYVVTDKREETFSAMNLALSEDDKNNTEQTEQKEEVRDTTNTSSPVEEEKQEQADYENYAGKLEITKIGFYKGFYPKESSLNNVKFNIKILDVSAYPDEENGNVIIIGHSGNYSNSYFANLYKLTTGDVASIYYNNHKYNYKIVNIYNVEKNGTVTIYRDENKSTMTLITCTKDDNTKQTVYILELQNVE